MKDSTGGRVLFWISLWATGCAPCLPLAEVEVTDDQGLFSDDVIAAIQAEIRQFDAWTGGEVCVRSVNVAEDVSFDGKEVFGAYTPDGHIHINASIGYVSQTSAALTTRHELCHALSRLRGGLGSQEGTPFTAGDVTDLEGLPLTWWQEEEFARYCEYYSPGTPTGFPEVLDRCDQKSARARFMWENVWRGVDRSDWIGDDIFPDRERILLDRIGANYLSDLQTDGATLWNVSNGTPPRLTRHDPQGRLLSARPLDLPHPDGNYFLAGGDGGAVLVYQHNTGNETQTRYFSLIEDTITPYKGSEWLGYPVFYHGGYLFGVHPRSSEYIITRASPGGHRANLPPLPADPTFVPAPDLTVTLVDDGALWRYVWRDDRWSAEQIVEIPGWIDPFHLPYLNLRTVGSRVLIGSTLPESPYDLWMPLEDGRLRLPAYDGDALDTCGGAAASTMFTIDDYIYGSTFASFHSRLNRITFGDP